MSQILRYFYSDFFRVTALALTVSLCFLWLFTVLFPLFPVESNATRYFFFYREAPFKLGTLLARWDAQIYLSIAERGYPSNNYTLYAFCPLYPFLIHLGTLITRNSFITALVINLTAISFGCWFLYKWAQSLGYKESAVSSVWFFVISPAVIFFLAPYTEAVFFFFSAACFYYLERRNYLYASILGLLAAITRPPGFLLLIPLIGSIFWQRQTVFKWQSFSPKYLRSQLWILIIPIAVVLMYLSGIQATGRTDFYTRASAHFGRQSPSLSGIEMVMRKILNFNRLPVHSFQDSQLDVIWILVYSSILVFSAKAVPLQYVLYAMSILLLPLLSGSTMSSVRVLAVSPIHYLVLGHLAHRWPWLGKAATVLSIGFAVVFGLLFTHWRWVA